TLTDGELGGVIAASVFLVIVVVVIVVLVRRARSSKRNYLELYKNKCGMAENQEEI
ncbi:hypothetical protein BgiMline_014456, partial [Biomphalaria glabrata]